MTGRYSVALFPKPVNPSAPLAFIALGILDSKTGLWASVPGQGRHVQEFVDRLNNGQEFPVTKSLLWHEPRYGKILNDYEAREHCNKMFDAFLRGN